ncbi:MAG: hypothetical protein ACLPVY_09985 [Acidimicrobiia bacterium]
MPAKQTTKKTTKKATAKKTTNKKSMSPAHKKALAEGRTTSATIDRYLSALNTPKTRGRKVSTAQLRSRLQAAEERGRTAIGLERVLAHQQARDLRARLSSAGEHTATDVKSLEREFCKVAKGFSERRGIRYGSWRDAGVPADVLQRAGIPRTRG